MSPTGLPSRSRPGRSSGPSDRPSCRRRHLLALAGTGGLFTLSGCLSGLSTAGSTSALRTIAPARLEFTDGFDAEAASLARTYGDQGVWGLTEGPDVDGPEYLGARRERLVVPGDTESSEAWVIADGAALVYRLEDEYRVWLWAGTHVRQREGRLGRTSVTRLSVGADAGDGWTLAAFAPRAAVREGPVPVSLDERGPSGRTPLPGGGIGSERAGTDSEGRFDVSWQGIARNTRSVNAVCEFRPRNEGENVPFEAHASFGVAGGRGIL